MDDFYNSFVDAGFLDADPSFSSVDSSGFSLSGFNFGPVATGLKFGGSLLGGFGALQQGKEIAGAYEYNAALSMQQGQFEVDQLDRAETILGGEQRAAYLKSGVTLSGSALDTILNSATQVELDKQTAMFNAQSKANMYDYQAKVAKNQAKFKFGASLLQGGIGLLGLL